jgi:hypothetical protein
MNSPRESMGAAAVRILSRTINRRRAARPRRFRPLAEPMEARAVLSHIALTPAMIDPSAVGRGPSAIVDGRPSSPGIGDMVVVNGQVEIQPGDVVVN